MIFVKRVRFPMDLRMAWSPKPITSLHLLKKLMIIKGDFGNFSNFKEISFKEKSSFKALLMTVRVKSLSFSFL